MSLALILPFEDYRDPYATSLISRIYSSVAHPRKLIEITEVEIFDDLTLIICNIRLPNGNDMLGDKLKRKIKRKLDDIFSQKGVWSVMEHPLISPLYDSSFDLNDFILMEIVVNRFTECLKTMKGVGRLSEQEVTITGQSHHLEYAISRLITNVKSINILLPEGMEEPEEADQAFLETGIPVHLTSDPEVLNRTSLWIRFPDDHEDFDALPQDYEGLILDLGARKLIDTRAKTIKGFGIELSEKMKKKIGLHVMDAFQPDLLASFIIGYLSNTLGKNPTEVSFQLGMRLSLKP